MALSQTYINGHRQYTTIYLLPADKGGAEVKIEVGDAPTVVELLDEEENDVEGVIRIYIEVEDDDGVEVLDAEDDSVGGVTLLDVEVCDDEEVELLDVEARGNHSCDNDINGKWELVIHTSDIEVSHSDKPGVEAVNNWKINQ